ncbi:hypothetical protein TorRG33x02_018240, partial [Trema orientale]
MVRGYVFVHVNENPSFAHMTHSPVGSKSTQELFFEIDCEGPRAIEDSFYQFRFCATPRIP